MRRTLQRLSPLILLSLLLTGCSSVGSKAASASVIYGVAAVLSLALLVLYWCIAKKKDPWYLLLFSSIMVVNIGYFALAISGDVGEALLANRVSYLGSVFLPLSMLMIIVGATHVRIPKWLPSALLGLAVVMFLIAASPGYLPIYYKDVSFAVVNGAATLIKEYGPLHALYLVYLLGYFGSMITVIIHATLQDKIDSLAYAVIIAIAVFVNLGVWMIEQLVDIDFEFLSVSYIISECFLLGLHFMMAEAEKMKRQLVQQLADGTPEPKEPEKPAQPVPSEEEEQLQAFRAGLSQLTPKERELFDCYIAGTSTDVIMEQLAIKENTLKFHSKNLYGKLGVKSRKQMMQLYSKLK